MTVVRHKSGTVAIVVLFYFEHMPFAIENIFPFPLSTTKLISDVDQTRPSYLMYMRQFICTLNLRSVKGEAARTKKNLLVHYFNI